MEIVASRIEDFRALTGLVQKYYVRDKVTGEYGGLYLWESPEAFDEYKASELRASIASAYKVKGEPRVEILDVLLPLRP